MIFVRWWWVTVCFHSCCLVQRVDCLPLVTVTGAPASSGGACALVWFIWFMWFMWFMAIGEPPELGRVRSVVVHMVHVVHVVHGYR